jgi:hypothetical protein
MTPYSRRRFLQQAAMGTALTSLTLPTTDLFAQAGGKSADPTLMPKGERPPPAAGVTVLNPRARVPVSHIIDDSTCLVNLAHFCIPQFHEVFPAAYRQEWKKLPVEIPDAFVRKFGEWTREHGVKGKYSIIPYPACVGWLDRDLPGWSKQELKESIKLAHTVLGPNWDFHPEMISHTRVIDTKTGRAYPDHTEQFMENWRWTDGKSTDQIADYIAYALRILKNIETPCEGMTTPGGFGNRALPELAQGTLQACRDVYQTEIPHYFRHLFTDERSVAPRVEYASGIDGPDAKCVVSIIGCTGDWFGGWDGITPGSVDKLITEDLKGGRMPEVIKRGEPAIMVCHWPGLYYNGEEKGFNILKEAVRRLDAGFDNLIWMKLSEISRYWAAKELTRIERQGNRIHLRAPFATPLFTLNFNAPPTAHPKLFVQEQPVTLAEVKTPLQLKDATWTRSQDGITVCFGLPKGNSRLEM